jgi:hypothetical protein
MSSRCPLKKTEFEQGRSVGNSHLMKSSICQNSTKITARNQNTDAQFIVLPAKY